MPWVPRTTRASFFAVLKDPRWQLWRDCADLRHLQQAGAADAAGQQPAQLAGLLLLPAWARLFALFWSATLPALAPGSGARFAGSTMAGTGHQPAGFAWPVLWLAPALLLAPLAGLLWRTWLKRKLGGMTGDCLGAGIEICEILLLGLLLLPIHR
jgi:adenosylcobinamide-GDP ribazoletransferase